MLDMSVIVFVAVLVCAQFSMRNGSRDKKSAERGRREYIQQDYERYESIRREFEI